MWASLREGDWITAERLKTYPLILLAFAAIAVAAMIALTHDRMGPDNQPLGTDFSQVWVAGREALAGAPEAPFDLDRHIAAQHKEFGPNGAVYGWHYPPFFLAVAEPLARLPYLEALLVWQVATLALYLATMAAITRDCGSDRLRALIAALAYPAVLVNLGHGQNGFLTAALLGGGFFFLERRPWVAGALFAALAYKPQFALALPAALIAGRHWRAIAAAALSLAAMIAASVAAFGVESWRAFFRSLAFTRAIVVEQGATGFEKIQSVFAAARLAGADVPAAYLLQSVTTLVAVVGVIWLTRTKADGRVKAAAAVTATLLSTPYCLDYDMMTLAPAIAFLAVHGRDKSFKSFEKSLLVFAFAAPLLARPVATMAPIPLGVAAMVLLFMSTLRHGRADAAQAGIASAAAS